MIIHKDIIIRLIFSFVLVAITIGVLGPVFINYLKMKLPGHHSEETDIDVLIRRQKERLRAQYGLHGDIVNGDSHKNQEAPNSNLHLPKEINQIYKETHWGGGEFLKEIQNEITKIYSYTIAETKINAFILLCEKRKYLHYLTAEHQTNKDAIKNFLVTLLIFFLITEEIRDEKYFIIGKIAKKLNISPFQLAIAFQIKLLMIIGIKKDIKEERLFSIVIILNQFSDETIKEASEVIAKRESNLWAKSPSQLLEELTLALTYASILRPIPKLKNKKDLITASEILGVTLQQDKDEIKKNYKKIALVQHPDKIVPLKLPKTLEKKAIEKFNQIQEAYELLMNHKN